MHTAQTWSLGELGVSCFPLLPTEDFRKFMGNWDQNLQQTEGTNSVRILGMVVLLSLPLFPSHLPCAHMQHYLSTFCGDQVTLSLTQHLGDEHVSRAWSNSTHQRGMFEKHVQLLEFSGRSTVVMNICKETCYLLNSEYPCSCYTSMLKCPVLYIPISVLFGNSSYSLWTLQSAVNIDASVYFEIRYSITHKVEWFWPDSDIKYGNRKCKTSY